MTSRRGAWIAVGLFFLAVLTVGVSGLLAQVWQPGPGPGAAGPGAGRFQVVTSSPEGIILLDTATGELYKAGPGDIKPYYMRPRIGQPDFGRDRDRDRIVDKTADPPPRDRPVDRPPDGRPRDGEKDLPKDVLKDRPARDKDVGPKDAIKDAPKDRPVRDLEKKDFKDKGDK